MHILSEKTQVALRPFEKWFIWFIAALFYATEFFQRVAPTVLATPLSRAFQITPAELGFIMSSYFYVYAVAQIPVGLLLDRFNIRWLLSASAFVVSAGTLLFAYAHFVSFLLLGRLLIGVGSAFGFVGCLKLAKNWFSGKQFGIVVGLTNSLGVVGALFAEEPLTLLSEHIGWQSSLFTMAMIGFGITILLAVFVRTNPRSLRHISESPLPPVLPALKKILSNHQSWLIGLYAGLMVAPVIAFAELWSVSYLQKTQHLSAALAAQANTLIFIGIGVGGPVHGWISGFINSRKIVMWYGNIVTLLLFILIPVLPEIPLIGIELILFLFGFFVSTMLVAFALNTAKYANTMSALVIAFTNMFIMVVGALFQPMLGFLLEHFGHHIHLLSQVSAGDFRKTVLILPVALTLNLVIVYFIRE